jgi:hypothetical protein
MGTRVALLLPPDSLVPSECCAGTSGTGLSPYPCKPSLRQGPENSGLESRVFDNSADKLLRMTGYLVTSVILGFVLKRPCVDQSQQRSPTLAIPSPLLLLTVGVSEGTLWR